MRAILIVLRKVGKREFFSELIEPIENRWIDSINKGIVVENIRIIEIIVVIDRIIERIFESLRIREK